MHQIALAQWAHDIRNALGTVALYVETLDSPNDSRTSKVVASTHALLAKAAAMCNDVVLQSRDGEHEVRRNGFDVSATLRQIHDFVAPTLPPGASLQVVTSGPARVMADPQDVFRILFNLVHNAATIARRSSALRRIKLSVECAGTTVVITVADDGPGLPEHVRTRLFRDNQSTTSGSGYGLAIARELAERNGGVLELADVRAGTAFLIELPLERAADHVAPRYRARNPQPRFA